MQHISNITHIETVANSVTSVATLAAAPTSDTCMALRLYTNASVATVLPLLSAF
jgi:hypothetical protein